MKIRLLSPRFRPCSGRARCGARGHGHRLECECIERALHRRGSGAPRRRPAHGDGARRGLRRGNAIDGRYEPYLYRGRRGFLGFEGRRRGDRCLSRPRQHRPGPAGAAGAAVQRLARRPPRIPRRSGSGSAIGEHAAAAMIAARTNDGRFGAPGFPVGTLAGPVASGPARVRQRPERVGAEREAVRAAEPVAVPLGCAVPAHERRLRDRVQPGEGHRLAERVRPERCSRRTRPCTGRKAPSWTWNRIMRTLSAQRGLTLEENARLFAMANMVVADTADQRLGRQGVLRLLAADHRHPRGGPGRQSRRRWPIRTGCR